MVNLFLSDRDASASGARRVWWLLALGGVAIVAASVALTSALKLHPCYLCVFQRLLYLVIAAGALFAAWTGGQRPGGFALSVAFGVLVWLAAAGGLAVAAYQTWLQAQPSAAFSCAGADPNLIERLVDWLDARIPVLFHNMGDCASKEFILFGLSLAGWSCLGFGASLGLATLALRLRLGVRGR
jgi:disulfide bond formation protein DsbB